MSIKVTTEFFTKNIIESIKKDAIQKGLGYSFYIDFQLTKDDLPFDFDEESFINYLKEAFLMPRFNLDDLGYKIRFTGKVLKIKHYNTFTGTFEPSEEIIKALRNLPNSTNF